MARVRAFRRSLEQSRQVLLTVIIDSLEYCSALANPRPRWQLLASLGLLVVGALSAAGVAWLNHALKTVIPTVRAPNLADIFFDRTPVTITFTVGGQTLEWPTTADDVRSNLTLWRRMHLAE